MKRWKGKIQTEKQYNRRLLQVENGKLRKKQVEPVEPGNECEVEGRRIIDLKVMSQHMHCSFCKEELWLKNIKSETKQGLASIFHVLCQHCLLMNKVPSGAKHMGLHTKKLFDINTEAALGTIHSGFGYTAVNKFMQTMNIPYMASNTHKRNEREIRPIIEQVVRESCQEATKLE